MSKQKQIGVVGVDSGQLMVCDPCYLEHQWNPKVDYPPRDVYEDQETHKRWQFVVGEELPTAGATPFPGRYDTPIAECDYQTPNDLIKSGQWRKVAIDDPRIGEYSYYGACKATQSKESAGQLHYTLGHAGAGVAFSSGYGDGVYPVIAHYNDEDRIIKVEIIMEPPTND